MSSATMSPADLEAALAACDYQDLRDRMMIADELEAAGRLVERRMAPRAGREVDYDEPYHAACRLMTAPLDRLRQLRCPFCNQVVCETDPCGHVVFLRHDEFME